MVCQIPARPIKILLTTDLSEITGVAEYQDGANLDAWVDGDGSVFVLIDEGKDVCFLEAEEFQSLEENEKVKASEAVEAEPQQESSPTPTPAAVHEAWGAYLAHEQEIAKASAEVAVAAVEWAKAQEAAKGAKKSFEGAVENLRSIIGRGPEIMPLFDRAVVGPSREELEVANQRAAKNVTGEGMTVELVDSEAWRATPIDVLFSDVERFGAKKQDAVREAIPTLGAFEDLRKKASLDGEPIRAYMPKGIGQDSCDQLEEAALNWRKRQAGKDAPTVESDDADDADDDSAE
jgi:hypothetical protein